MWEQDCIVFNNAFRQIEEAYSDSEKLFGQIARLLDLNLTPEVRATLSQTLGQLDELGLSECSYRETRAAYSIEFLTRPEASRRVAAHLAPFKYTCRLRLIRWAAPFISSIVTFL